MCKSKDNSTDSEIVDLANSTSNDEYDKFFSTVNDLKSNLTSMAKSLIHFTNDSVSDLNDRAKDYSINRLFDFDNDSENHINEFRKSVKSAFEDLEPRIDDYFPKVYEIRDSFKDDRLFGQFSPWFGRSNFHDLFSGSFGSGKTPYGYYSYKTPSIRYYNDCLNKNGESVWDSKGYWRCLFPNSEIANEFVNYKKEHLPNEILTKDDFDKAVEESGAQKGSIIDLGEKGTFFKRFEDYLNWKNIMYENVKRERQLRKEKYLERNKSESANKKGSTNNEPSNEIVSSIVQSTYNANSDTNEVELKEIRTEYYKDGTSLTKKITKTKPTDAKDWVNVVENVEHGTANEAKNSGWFWNTKDN